MTKRPVAADTSVAVPLLVASHAQHGAVARWARGRALHLSGHALIETYAVLTRLPGDARVSPADAVTLIEENFAEPFVLSPAAVLRVLDEFSRRNVAGGAAYDGLVALAAREHGAILATRDSRALSTYEALAVLTEVVPGDD